MIATIDDRLNDLWEGCLNNNRKQQEALYKLLAPKMMGVCLRYAKDKDTAQDILQEGFMKVFKNMQYYRGEGSREGWVRRIIVHCAINHYRKAKRMVLVDDFSESTLNNGYGYNGHALDTNDLLKLVQQLPDNYRSIFNMYAIDGYSHKEIGNNLNISEILSRTNLNRARTILKNQITQMGMRDNYCMAG
jgi:RNA polymerase sigma-70 factor (ECF subfamily)